MNSDNSLILYRILFEIFSLIEEICLKWQLTKIRSFLGIEQENSEIPVHDPLDRLNETEECRLFLEHFEQDATMSSGATQRHFRTKMTTKIRYQFSQWSEMDQIQTKGTLECAESADQLEIF